MRNKDFPRLERGLYQYSIFFMQPPTSWTNWTMKILQLTEKDAFTRRSGGRGIDKSKSTR